MPTRCDESFRITQLKGARVAIWPVISSEVDDSLRQTVAKEYPSGDAFLDALGSKFAASLGSVVQADSITPEGVIGAFRDKDFREVLDPSSLLNTANMESRFGLQNDALGAYLSRLRGQAILKQVQFAIIPVKLSMARRLTQGSGSTGAYTGGPNGGAYVSEDSSSAHSQASLRIVVIDVPGAKVAWDGQIGAIASRNFMKATALHELEADLATHFTNAVLGIEDRILTP